MAKWVVYENADGKLTYVWHNHTTRAVKNLGTSGNVDDTAIIDWWVNKATPSPGDLLVLPGGRVIQLYPFDDILKA